MKKFNKWLEKGFLLLMLAYSSFLIFLVNGTVLRSPIKGALLTSFWFLGSYLAFTKNYKERDEQSS